MFNQKEKQVVSILIEFNLTKITRWIESASEIEDIIVEKRNWEDDIIQNYGIDIVPYGDTGDAYFHRKKQLFSMTIGGYDVFDGANKERTLFTEKIDRLSWEVWRQYLSLKVNDKLILLVPIAEIVELQVIGGVKNEYQHKI